MLNRLLTTKDVASYLQVDPNTVYRWCRAGRLSGIKMGRDWRIEQRDLDAFLAARKHGRPSNTLQSIFLRRLSAPEHILVMSTEPEEVYRLEVEFFRTAVAHNHPILKGCWWQRPEAVRERYIEAGLPVEALEAQGRFVTHDFWAAYRAEGADGVLGLWQRQSDAWKGECFWASGSHLLDQWKDHWDMFFEYESRLHTILCQLPGVVICPCVTTAAVAEGTTHLLQLVSHHHGLLFMTQPNPILMRSVAA